jgi:hypothetical protein
MRVLRGAALWIWDFVVGDDWVTALGVVCALGATAVIAAAGAAAWWVMPLAVAALLARSMRQAATAHDPATPTAERLAPAGPSPGARGGEPQPQAIRGNSEE